MTNRNYIELLRSSVLFAGGDPPEWFIDGVKLRALEHGEALYTPDSFAQALGLVASGTLEAENRSGIALNVLGKGTLFGVAAVFGEVERYVSTIRAKSPARVLLIERSLLERLFLERPDCALRYVAFLTDRVRFLNAKIESFTAPSAQASLEHWLVQASGGGSELTVASWSAVSRALDMSRTSLYRALDSLEADGKIARDGKKVILRRNLS